MGIIALMFSIAKDTTGALVQDKVLGFMEGYPGDLYEEPFVDFSTTRNYALQVSVALPRDALVDKFAAEHDT